MLKKTIDYVDFDGNERSEDFYFNLTEAEIVQMEGSVSGGYGQLLEEIIKKQDVTSLMGAFDKLISDSYGVKDPNGRGFRKSKELLDDFKSTEAYSKLFMEIATSADAAAAFVEGILPAKAVAAAKAKNGNVTPIK